MMLRMEKTKMDNEAADHKENASRSREGVDTSISRPVTGTAVFTNLIYSTVSSRKSDIILYYRYTSYFGDVYGVEKSF